MIDIKAERIMTLTEASKVLPRRRAGKRPHVSTLYRWATRGLNGAKLEVLRVGGTLCTSKEALQRFFECLTDPILPPSQPSATRQRSIRMAAQELDDAGL